MDFTYHLSNIYVEAYAGKFNKTLTLKGDENEYMLEQVKIYEDKLFSD